MFHNDFAKRYLAVARHSYISALPYRKDGRHVSNLPVYTSRTGLISN
jgi:hypothetical protein